MRRAGQTGTQDFAIEIRKDTGEIGNRRVRVENLLGIGINGSCRKAGRQDHAVAIDDVAAADPFRRRLRGGCPARRAAEHGEIDQPAGHHQKGEREDDAGCE
jgi:hypothetical protein